MSSRSFFYHEQQFPICARCTGEAIGIILSIFLFFFNTPSLYFAMMLMIPMLVDGFVQKFTKYESTNVKRFVTGLLFGVGLAALVSRSTNMAFQYGVELGRQL